MAARKNLYDVLGVPKDADKETIRKAYRKLARQFHPDVNPGDTAAEDRFKEVSEAYSVLADEEKRRNYDEFGDVSLESGFDADKARQAREAFGARFGGGPGGPGGPGGARFAQGFPGGEESFEFGDVDDLLGQLFGARGRARGGPRAMRGPDLETELTLDFLDAARGGEKRVTLPLPTGGTETVTVRIPAGVADGGRIRLPHKGAGGPGGGPRGDLWATIRVLPHPVFRREGRDLLLDLPVTVSEAVEGARVEVPTLEGRATVTIPAGTDGGQKLRLRGKGIPDPSGGAQGDLYVIVRVRVPRDLDDEGRQALETLRCFDPEDPRQEIFR